MRELKRRDAQDELSTVVTKPIAMETVRKEKSLAPQLSASTATVSWHTLPDGTRLEVITQLPTTKSDKSPLLFLHGISHGAWCWKEHFMPYFASNGYPTYALSYRGHGDSDGKDLKVAGTFQSHMDDIRHFQATLPKKPIIIGHSFGGLFVRVLCQELTEAEYAGAVMLCSVLPEGRHSRLQKIMEQGFFTFRKGQQAIDGKTYLEDPAICKFLFFSKDIPEENFQKYFAQISNHSRVLMVDPSFWSTLQGLPPPKVKTPSLLLGGKIDLGCIKKWAPITAKHFNAKCMILPGIAHDAMLDTRWENAAKALLDWLNELPSSD